ncbi:hypothetical protein KKA00_09680 [bacterium]|nr:hypothetical protein [bacterium]MBU1652480.1 hypothetical protein [bacterium]MBU1880578.1 hypothetical protein [bacterium]
MTLLTQIGVLEIAFSAVILPVGLLKPFQDKLVKDRKQLLQAHLDYFFMGILLILAGSILQPLASWIEPVLIFGSVCNPTVFMINSVAPDLPQNPVYRLFILASCGAVALAWVGIVIGVIV